MPLTSGQQNAWKDAWRQEGGPLPDRHLEFTMGSVSRQTLAQYGTGKGDLLSITIVGGSHSGTIANLDMRSISGSSTAFPVCTLNAETVSVRLRNSSGVTIYSPGTNPYAPPELGPRGKMTNADACADLPRNPFTNFARWCLRVRTSTFHPGLGTFDADGFVACYLNETLLFSQSGMTIPIDAAGATIFFAYGAVADMGKFWLIRASVPPPTDANGDFVGSPANVVFFDNFASGIDPVQWPFNNGVTALANCGPLNGPGVSGLNTDPATSWWNGDRMHTANLQSTEDVPPDPPPGVTVGTWSKAWRE